MGDIKRQINSITDLKRASTDVNFVYRGATLVWQRSTPGPIVLDSFRNSYYQMLLTTPQDTKFETSYYYNKLNNI